MKPTEKTKKNSSKVSSRSHLEERVPRLRFPGFEGEWTPTQLSRILHERKTYAEKDGSYPHATLSKEGISGKTERYNRDFLVSTENKEYKITLKDDLCYNPANLKFGVICLNTFGSAIFSPIYVTFEIDKAYSPTFVGASLTQKDFIGYALRFQQGTVYERMAVSPEDLLSISRRFPSLAEQKKIASLVALVDARISSQRRLVELLKKHKRGVIEQIFGRRLNMGNDSAKWDVVELRDLFKKVARRNRDGMVKNVITNSAEFGLIPQSDFFDKSIAVDGNTNNYYVIRTGDFVYNPRKSTTAPFGPFNRYVGTEDGIISPLYTCLVPKGNASPEYLAWYFRSTAWHRYVYDNGSQGARHDRVNMTDDLLFGIPVLLPPIAVQERIADGLNAIDARWSSANKVLANLEKMKRGLLQQLFA